MKQYQIANFFELYHQKFNDHCKFDLFVIERGSFYFSYALIELQND